MTEPTSGLENLAIADAPLLATPSAGGGDELLCRTEAFLRRFCRLPNELDYAAVVLWVAATHFIDQLASSGRLAFLSPEPGSGKTRALDILALVCRNPLLIFRPSEAVLFRMIEAQQPALLIDEVDAIFGTKRAAEAHEGIRAVLNVGYRQGATVPRVGGADRDEVQLFNVFCPVAMAGLGSLPDTLLSRSIIIRMKRRAPNERVEPYRERLHRPEGEVLQAEFAEWASVTELAYPELPEGVEDRDADVWESLIMVADAAGGEWPRRARDACVKFVASKADSEVSLGVRLLRDIQTVWPKGQSAVGSQALLSFLVDLDSAPWADLQGDGLKPRKLSGLLSEYEIKSRDVRLAAGVFKGYQRSDFLDAWSRYLPETAAN